MCACVTWSNIMFTDCHKTVLGDTLKLLYEDVLTWKSGRFYLWQGTMPFRACSQQFL